MRFKSTFVQSDEGVLTTAVLEADSERALAAALQDAGRILIRARPLPDRKLGRGPRLPAKKLLLMTQAFDSLIKGGVPMLSALEALRAQEADEKVLLLYDGLIQTVAKGRPFSDALEQYPRAFPKLYVELVRAGEASGSMEQVIGYLAGYLEWTQDIRATIKKAATYPIVVMSAAYGLVLFLLSFVVPRLADLLTKISTDLPPATRALLSTSDFVATNLIWILLGTVGGVVGLVFFVRSDIGSRLFTEGLVRMPVVRTIVMAVSRAQISRTLGVMLDSGITLTESLALVARTVRVRVLSEGVERCRELLTRGTSVTRAFEEAAIMPGLAMALLSAGEESGSLPAALNRLSEFYDRDAKNAVERGLAILEPLTTVLLGGIVVLVAGIVLNTLYGAMQGMAP